VNLGIGAATEADLLAAQKAAPEKAVEIESLLTFLRAAKDAQAQAADKPIRVEITNASEFADKRGTVVRVERDGSGLLTGALAQKVWSTRKIFRAWTTEILLLGSVLFFGSVGAEQESDDMAAMQRPI